MRDIRNEYKCLVEMSDEMRTRGKPRSRWEDDIKRNLK
jgi:hypothetical protein